MCAHMNLHWNGCLFLTAELGWLGWQIYSTKNDQLEVQRFAEHGDTTKQQIMGYSDCSLSSCWRRTAKRWKSPAIFPERWAWGWYSDYCIVHLYFCYYIMVWWSKLYLKMRAISCQLASNLGPGTGHADIFQVTRIKRTLRPNKKFDWGETCTNMHKP